MGREWGLGAGGAEYAGRHVRAEEGGGVWDLFEISRGPGDTSVWAQNLDGGKAIDCSAKYQIDHAGHAWKFVRSMSAKKFLIRILILTWVANPHR